MIKKMNKNSIEQVKLTTTLQFYSGEARSSSESQDL